jgi:hypothetical protein
MHNNSKGTGMLAGVLRLPKTMRKPEYVRSVESSIENEMLDLKELLYSELEKHGYFRLAKPLTLGFADSVVMGDVEITGIPHHNVLQVDIALSVDGREDSCFFKAEYLGHTYLQARKKIYATKDNLQEALTKIYDIAKQGRGLVYWLMDVPSSRSC